MPTSRENRRRRFLKFVFRRQVTVSGNRMLTRKLTKKMLFATWPDFRHVSSEKSLLRKWPFDLVSGVCRLPANWVTEWLTVESFWMTLKTQFGWSKTTKQFTNYSYLHEFFLFLHLFLLKILFFFIELIMSKAIWWSSLKILYYEANHHSVIIPTKTLVLSTSCTSCKLLTMP